MSKLVNQTIIDNEIVMENEINIIGLSEKTINSLKFTLKIINSNQEDWVIESTEFRFWLIYKLKKLELEFGCEGITIRQPFSECQWSNIPDEICEIILHYFEKFLIYVLD